MRGVMLAIGLMALAGCTTTSVRSAAKATDGAPVAPLAQNVEILQVLPDVQLNARGVTSLDEPRADWSQAARQNLNAAVAEWFKAKGHTTEAFDPSDSMSGQIGQIIRLNEVVGQSIIYFEYFGASLPTKQGTFDWTVGPGAKALMDKTGSRYGLFLVARGAYSDAAHFAAVVIVGGVLGSQGLAASLVDLETGQVVWFNVANVAPGGADMRTPEGAAALVKDVMKDAPL